MPPLAVDVDEEPILLPPDPEDSPDGDDELETASSKLRYGHARAAW